MSGRDKRRRQLRNMKARRDRRAQDEQQAAAAEINASFMAEAQPLIDAAIADGTPLTLDKLQAVLDEARERWNLDLHTPTGDERAECIEALVTMVSLLGHDSGLFQACLEEIHPEGPGPTTSGCMGILAENLDRWIGTKPSPVPQEALEACVMDGTWLTTDFDIICAQIVLDACQGQAFADLTRLVGEHGGEDVFMSLIVLTAELTARWSASVDEYHDELIAKVLV